MSFINKDYLKKIGEAIQIFVEKIFPITVKCVYIEKQVGFDEIRTHSLKSGNFQLPDRRSLPIRAKAEVLAPLWLPVIHIQSVTSPFLFSLQSTTI